MNKNISGDEESVKKSFSARIFDKEVSVTDRSALQVSHRAQIMAIEFAREREQLTQKITYLETEINAKEKEIAILQQTLCGRDKKMTDLKEKLSQLQQNGQRNNFDFANQMAAMDKKLQETKKNIAELEAGVIFNVMKNEMEAKESQSEPQAFNGKDYFDHQPSWFDTLSNNGGYLEVENFPVTAKEIEDMKNVRSNSRLSTESAKGKDYFDHQPSWFDTPSKNGGCLKLENFPVTAKDLEAMKNCKSNLKPYTAAAKDCGEAKCQQARVSGGSFVRAEMKKNCPPPQREDESKSITGSISQKVNPFSGKAKALDRPAQSPVNKNRRPQVEKSSLQVHPRNISNLSFARQKNLLLEKAKALDRPIPDCAAADIRGTEVVINTLPVQLKRVPSNSITDSSGNKVNPFSQRAKFVTKPSHIPVAKFAQTQTVMIDAEVVINTLPVQLKRVPSNSITDSSGNKVNPFSQRAKFVTKPSHIPVAKFAQTQTVMIDAAFKTGEISPCSEKARGSLYSFHRPLPPTLASIVPSGSQIAFAHLQIKRHSIPQTEQGLLKRTFNKWFGSYF